MRSKGSEILENVWPSVPPSFSAVSAASDAQSLSAASFVKEDPAKGTRHLISRGRSPRRCFREIKLHHRCNDGRTDSRLLWTRLELDAPHPFTPERALLDCALLGKEGCKKTVSLATNQLGLGAGLQHRYSHSAVREKEQSFSMLLNANKGAREQSGASEPRRSRVYFRIYTARQ